MNEQPRFSLIPAVLAAALACGVSGHAQHKPPGGALAERFKQLDKNGDGKISAAEFPGSQFTQMDTNGDGFVTMEEARAFYARRGARPPAATGTAQRRPPDLLSQYGNVTPTPHKEEIAEQRPGEPPLKRMPDSDATRDAAGRGQMFESISATGLTNLQEGMNGVAIVDLNRDGLLDIVATYSPPRGAGGPWAGGERLRVFINDGSFGFTPTPSRSPRRTIANPRSAM